MSCPGASSRTTSLFSISEVFVTHALMCSCHENKCETHNYSLTVHLLGQKCMRVDANIFLNSMYCTFHDYTTNSGHTATGSAKADIPGNAPRTQRPAIAADNAPRNNNLRRATRAPGLFLFGSHFFTFVCLRQTYLHFVPYHFWGYDVLGQQC